MSKKRLLEDDSENAPTKAVRNYYTASEFDSFCEKTLNESESDFEKYIEMNPQFSELNYFISAIDPAPEGLFRSVFVEMWFSKYAAELQLSKDQAFAILRNIKGFEQRKAIALDIVETNDYKLSDLKNIVYVLAYMSEEELHSTDNEDEMLRVFETKLRLAVAWIGRFDEESKNGATEAFCQEFNFFDSKNNLEKVLKGFSNCEDVIEEYRETLKDEKEVSGALEDLAVVGSDVSQPNVVKMQKDSKKVMP